MTHVFRRVTNVFFALLLAVMSVNLSGVLGVSSAYADAPGNNGTLKVHELNTPPNSESNDPKVCVFNFEAFGLDPNQTGNITIETQSGTPVITPLIVNLMTDASGNGETAYINSVNPALTLPNGHYKATLDNKFGTDPGDKAKSKVFKVECAAPTQVTPAAPTKVDPCGTINDSYSIPTTTGVSYLINGNVVTAGTYPGTGTVVISAVANQGYALQGTASWTFTFTNSPCTITVTPAAPIKTDLCGTPNDSYTIPTSTGVLYKVNNVEKIAGTYAGVGSVTIVATPLPGYVLTGQTSWTFTFSSVKCNVTPATPAKVDLCGTANDTYTIPNTANVIYKVNGTVKSAGIYSGSGAILIDADPAPGYQIQGNDDWLFIFTNLPCSATPTSPTKVDVCGTANDTYTIPSTTGIEYKVNGTVKAPGTYQASGLVFIDADAKPGYFIPLFTQDNWLFFFTNSDCLVTAGVPSSTDVCGTANDTYTIPSTTGVIYKVNGQVVGAGSYNANAMASITVTAQALQGYDITGAKSWTLTFPNTTACPAPVLAATAECTPLGVLVTIANSGNADGDVTVNGNTVTIPADDEVTVTVPFTAFKADALVLNGQTVLLDKAFDCTPGRGSIGGPEPTTPSVVLAKTTVTTPSGIMLPETGANSVHPLIKAFTLVVAGLATYGAVFFLVNRRDLASKK